MTFEKAAIRGSETDLQVRAIKRRDEIDIEL